LCATTFRHASAVNVELNIIVNTAECAGVLVSWYEDSLVGARPRTRCTVVYCVKLVEIGRFSICDCMAAASFPISDCTSLPQKRLFCCPLFIESQCCDAVRRPYGDCCAIKLLHSILQHYCKNCNSDIIFCVHGCSKHRMLL